MLELARRVALGVHVRGFFQLERAFARDGVVNAAAEIEKGAGGGIFARKRCGSARASRRVARQGRRAWPSSSAMWLSIAAGSMRPRRCGFIEAEQIEHGELAGEALGRGNGLFNARGQRHRDVGFARHGGGRDIGDGESLWPRRRASRSAASVSRVSPDCEMTSTLGLRGSTPPRHAVFARVLDIDGEAAEIFEKNFGGKAAVAAGAAGGDENFAGGIGPACEAAATSGFSRPRDKERWCASALRAARRSRAAFRGESPALFYCIVFGCDRSLKAA